MPRPAKPIPGEEHLKRRPGAADWQIDFSIDGRRFRRSSGTGDKAQAAALALAEHARAWDDIRLGVAVKRDLTVNDAFVRFWQEVAQHTAHGRAGQRYHMHVLVQALGAATPLRSLDDAAINLLVQRLRAPRQAETRQGRCEVRSPATINRYLTTLAVVCARARKMWNAEVGTWTPSAHHLEEPKGREVYLDHAAARRLLDAACGHLRPILLMAFCTGLRARNVIELQWEQVSLDLGRAVLVQKGGKPHSVPLPVPALDLLAHLQPAADARRGPVFTFGNPAFGCTCEHCRNPAFAGQPIRSVRRAFVTAAKAAGVREVAGKRLRFHDLRHTFASWLLASTGDLLLVRDALGHRDVATTQRYAHLLPGRRERAVSAAVAGLLDDTAGREREAG